MCEATKIRSTVYELFSSVQMKTICANVLLIIINAIPLIDLTLTAYGILSPLPISTPDIIAGDVFFEIVDPQDLEYTYRLRPAKNFGNTFSEKLEAIRLVPTDPPEACGVINNARQIKGYVALMVRGHCSFLSKTINAEKAGAVAAIITEYDSDSLEFDYYIEMVHDNTNRDTQIPAGFLLGKNGLIIHNTLRRLQKPHALINIPVNLTFTPPSRINHPPWLGW